LFGLTVNVVCAQTPNWKIENGEPILELIANDKTKSYFITVLKSKSYVDRIDTSGHLLATLKRVYIDSYKYGGNLGTNGFLTTGKWDGVIKIDFKDNRYRFQLFDLVSHIDDLTGTPVSATLREMVIKKSGEFKPAQKQTLEIIRHWARDEFLLVDIDGDW
jgi:hypothetical protein